MSRRPLRYGAAGHRRIPVKTIGVAAVGVMLFGALLGYAIAGSGSARTAPDFRLPAMEGNAVSLKEFQGKKNVLLYFNMGTG